MPIFDMKLFIIN